MSKARAQALKGVDRYFYLRRYDGRVDASELDPIYALRYAIYCVECGFLSPEDYPAGLESDEYDVRSQLFAASNDADEIVGTSRLVVCESADQEAPLMVHCPPDSGFEPPPWAEVAEVSRLAVNKNYRRRQGDTVFGVNEGELDREPEEVDIDSGKRRANAPLLVLGLYREMYRYSRSNGIRYWYAAMEDSLARVLAFFGFNFKVIGPRHDYYGPVRPYLGDLDVLEADLRASNPDLLAWFQAPGED